MVLNWILALYLSGIHLRARYKAFGAPAGEREADCWNLRILSIIPGITRLVFSQTLLFEVKHNW